MSLLNRHTIANIFSLMRINQYVKNLLIFAPPFFGSKILDSALFNQLLTAFVGFSLVASFVYIINDIRDAAADKHHPTKSSRPLAKGSISKTQASVIAAISLILGLLIIPQSLLGIVIGYIALNFLYTFKIKEIALLDIITIALMYILRLLAGSIIAMVALSHWIIILTFLLALFLAISKRYDDLQYSNKEQIRTNINGYTAAFIENTMSILASIITVAYILYTISPEVADNFNCQYVYLTSIFVLCGILRYLQLTFVYKRSSSPTKLLYQDTFLKTDIMLWVLSFAYIIYF